MLQRPVSVYRSYFGRKITTYMGIVETTPLAVIKKDMVTKGETVEAIVLSPEKLKKLLRARDPEREEYLSSIEDVVRRTSK